jgi:PUB domain
MTLPRIIECLFSTCSEAFSNSYFKLFFQLLVVTATIAADVKTIKEEMLKLNSAASVAPTADPDTASEVSYSEGKATPPVELTTEQYLAILRSAVKDILNHRIKLINDQNGAASSGSTPDLLNAGSDEKKDVGSLESDDAFKKSCGALTMYVRNVLDNPTLPRYRKITTTNVSFKTLVQPLTGYVEVLNAIGFRSSGTGASNFEWTWQSDASLPDAKGKDSTVRSGGKPDEAGVKEILTECTRLFEICTLKGPLALAAELDKLSVQAETTASNETKKDRAEGTSSPAIRAASSSLESEVMSTSDIGCAELMSEARSLSKVQYDISAAISSEEKGPESTKAQEAAIAIPLSPLCFKDVRKSPEN